MRSRGSTYIMYEIISLQNIYGFLSMDVNSMLYITGRATHAWAATLEKVVQNVVGSMTGYARLLSDIKHSVRLRVELSQQCFWGHGLPST